MEYTIEENDMKLISFVRDNNEEAKDYLYNKYSPLIHKEINKVKKKAKMLGIEYADLTQEAMLAFSNAIYNFKEDEDVKFITFATLCIRRKLTNYIVKFETNKNKTLKSSLALDAFIDVEETTTLAESIEEPVSTEPLRIIINSETLDETHKIIEEKLSLNEKKALQYDLIGKSADEIATLMNMNNKQVYNLLHRARRKIKN